MQPGYLRTPNGQLVPVATLGDYGVWDLNIADWLKGWNQWATNVKSVASGVQTVTGAASAGLQNANTQGLFQPSAADAFAQQYNLVSAVTPGGEKTLLLVAGGVVLLFLMSRKRGGR